MEYYKGKVFEEEIMLEVKNEEGKKVVLGQVGGGGRYEGIVQRLSGEKVKEKGL